MRAARRSEMWMKKPRGLCSPVTIDDNEGIFRFYCCIVWCGGRNFFRLIKRLCAPSIFGSREKRSEGAACRPTGMEENIISIYFSPVRKRRAQKACMISLSLSFSLGKWPAQLDVFPKCNCHAYFTAILLHLHPLDPRGNGEWATTLESWPGPHLPKQILCHVLWQVFSRCSKFYQQINGIQLFNHTIASQQIYCWGYKNKEIKLQPL